jgi:hypothetical protein
MGRKQRRAAGMSYKQLDARQRSKDDGVVESVVCPVGKLPYRSRAAAHRKMVKLRQSANYVDRGHPLHAYECPACEYWHVGHDTRNYGQR